MHTEGLQPPYRAFAAGSIVVAVLTFTLWALVEQRQSSARFIELVMPTGVIRVEVADAAKTRAKGLSNRDTVKADGMLLEWSAAGRHAIWMDQMRFALDLVWLDQKGRVLAVLADVAPCVQQPCPVYEPPGTAGSVAVLELPAGHATRYGLTLDMRVRRASTTSAHPY
jgi:uncharacterized membrane protein (UPF0127 family)